jgi:hypothetical protein
MGLIELFNLFYLRYFTLSIKIIQNWILYLSLPSKE